MQERNIDRELSKSKDFTNILANIEDVNGRKIGFDLVERVVSGKKRLLIMGEPSGGKTTLIAQFAYELDQRDYAPERYVFYDQVLGRVESEIKRENPRIKNRDSWGPEHWAMLDQGVFEAISETDGKRALIEVPGVGKKYGLRTRGKNAIKALAAESEDIIFAYNVADPSTQLWGAFVREEILNTPDDRVFKVLKRRFNAEIVGIDDTVEIGKIFKRSVRWAAAREHIDAIDKEVLEMARTLDRSIMVANRDLKINEDSSHIYEHILGDLSDPDHKTMQVEKAIESAASKVKLKTVYAEHYLKNELGLDDSKGVVIFNPYVKNIRICIDARLFGRNRS